MASSPVSERPTPAPERHRVVIVDDHPVVQMGWRYVIDASRDFVVAGAAEDRRSAIQRIEETKADLLVTDLSLGKENGLALVEDAHRKWPDMPILVVSMHAEKNFALKSFHAGALGYLQKDTAMTDLVVALRMLVADGAYISDAFRPALTAMMRDAANRPLYSGRFSA